MFLPISFEHITAQQFQLSQSDPTSLAFTSTHKLQAPIFWNEFGVRPWPLDVCVCLCVHACLYVRVYVCDTRLLMFARSWPLRSSLVLQKGGWLWKAFAAGKKTCPVLQMQAKRQTCRVGQNRIYTPYMTVYLVISLPKIPYLHRIYMVLANSTNMSCIADAAKKTNMFCAAGKKTNMSCIAGKKTTCPVLQPKRQHVLCCRQKDHMFCIVDAGKKTTCPVLQTQAKRQTCPVLQA